MKDETFMQWMSKHYPHLVKRVRHYAMLMFGMGFILGLYFGVFGQLFVQNIPEILGQLRGDSGIPLYGIYLMVLFVSFGAFYLGRHPSKKGRK